MTTVTISLPESLKTFIDEQMATKGYGNVSEYFRSLLRAAQEREEDTHLEALLVEGLTAGGDDIPLSREFWTDLKAEAMDSAKKTAEPEKEFVKQVIRPNAKDDILRQFRYYLLEDALEAGNRFLDAVDESIETLCKMPEIGAPKQFKNPILAGLRSWAVKGFEDVLIFYVVQPNALRVVRVLHGKRDLHKILERERDDEAIQ